MNIVWIFIAILTFTVESAASGEKIRVRLQANKKEIRITGLGLNFNKGPGAFLQIAVPAFDSVRLKLERAEPKPIWQVRGSSGSDQKFFGDELRMQGELIRLGPVKTPDRLIFKSNERGRFDVISELDVEEYLLSVLPSEMPAGWPMEALKAQAVAARTYALRKLQDRGGGSFHVEADVSDQVFELRQDLTQSLVEKVATVVTATSGEFLADKTGRPIYAYYHSDCGGTTAEPMEVWGHGPRLQSVVDSSCPLNPFSRWAYRVNSGEIQKRLAGEFAELSSGEITKIEPIGVTPSGRVGAVRIQTAAGLNREIPAHVFRRLLGYSNVKSTRFAMAWRPGELSLTGRGNGHGVGMCQWGAKHLAQEGKTYRQILSHYYPASRLIYKDEFLASKN